MCLQFNSPESLHTQLKQKLKKKIYKGVYQKKIPSERELMEEYNVSRTTVRFAVSSLVSEGVLTKSHGRGTFISTTPVQDWLGTFQSFTETIKKTGKTPGSQLLFKGVIHDFTKVESRLGIKKIYLIERLRFADQIPIAIEKHYFPENIGKKLEKYDLDTAVIYDLLEKELGLSLWRAKQSITSSIVMENDAKNLNISNRSSVLMSERIIFDSKGHPIEFLNSIFRPDMFSYNVEMKRSQENE